MKNKRTLLFLSALMVFAVLWLVGCGKEAASATSSVAALPPSAAPVVTAPVASSAAPAVAATYQDGVYFAMDDAFASSGWKETVTITVKNGKITAADWNGVNVNGGVDKKTYDKAGKYNMVKFGKAQAEWYQQAIKAEAYLIQTQDPLAISYKDDAGHTDDIAGVSVHVNTFFQLAAKALAIGPVGRGQYQDGAYFAIDGDFASSGWKEYVALTVVNGRIASVNWNGVNKTGDIKKAFDKAGNYNMVKFGKAQAEWYQQAEKVEAYLMATQDPLAISYKDDAGHTDDIAGVSVHVNSFYALVAKALASGTVALGSYADGGYYAEEAAFGSSGWKGTLSLFVANGHIASVNWSGVNASGEDKKKYSLDGKYGMVANGKASAEWHEQAAKVEAYLMATQDPAKITYRADNTHTDDIAGATIHVNDFYALVGQALANGVKK
ncbi:MAG: hypothetical protein AB9828_09065 [Sphaerochaetaceae bacterium]